MPPAEGEVSNETVVVVVTHKNLTSPPGPDSTSWLLEQPYRFIVLAKDLPEGSPDNFINHKNIK